MSALSHPRRGQVEWAIAGVLLVGVMLVCVASFYPGTSYWDSFQTIVQAKTGPITDAWSPVGSYVLRAWLKVGLSVSDVYLVQTALMILGVFALVRHALSTAWAAIATVVIILWPTNFAIISTLSRDVFFIAFALLALAALASAYRAPHSEVRTQRIWVGVALALAFLAFLWRQNALVLVLVVAAAGFVLLRGTGGELWKGRKPTRAAWAATGAAVVAVIASVGIAQVTNRVMGVDRVHQERYLYIYDLAAISKDTGKNQFDSASLREPTVWKGQIYGQANLNKRFDWTNVITIYPPLEEAVRSVNPTQAELAQQTSDLRSSWRSAVLSNPGAYLKERARVSASMLGLTRRPVDSYPFNEVGFHPIGQFDLGKPPRFTHRNRNARDYIAKFAGPKSVIPLDIVLFYVVIGAALGVYLWRRRPRDRGLLFAILGFQWISLPFFFILTMATSYRYLAFFAPLTMVLAAWSIAQFAADRKTSTT